MGAVVGLLTAAVALGELVAAFVRLAAVPSVDTWRPMGAAVDATTGGFLHAAGAGR